MRAAFAKRIEASDGVWSSTNTVTIFVVAAPTNFTAQCVSNGPGVFLKWGLDAIVQEMEADDGLTIDDFQIYRRTDLGSILWTTAERMRHGFWPDRRKIHSHAGSSRLDSRCK